MENVCIFLILFKKNNIVIIGITNSKLRIYTHTKNIEIIDSAQLGRNVFTAEVLDSPKPYLLNTHPTLDLSLPGIICHIISE